MSSPHRLVNPPELPQAVGFSHVVMPAAGRTVYLAGQGGHRPDGTIAPGLVEQFAQACRNVATGLEAAGASAADVVSLQIFVTDLPAYRAALRPLGEAYRRIFGDNYPAMALLGVDGLFDPVAQVELLAVAIVPEP